MSLILLVLEGYPNIVLNVDAMDQRIRDLEKHCPID